MSNPYLDMVRGQRRRSGGFQFTSKTLLTILAFAAMIASGVYWWGVQSQLAKGQPLIAAAFTLILVLAPPCLTSFLIPWSPGGMLLQRINARTTGYVVVVACALFLLYYSFQIQWSWWAAQPVVADSGLVYQQVLIGIIGFVIIPALLWTPVTPEELVEQVRQAHLVKRYELQTQADIAILRATLLRAQEKALIGFANLTVAEREELAGVMRGLVTSIDATLHEVGQSVKTVSGATIHFDVLEDNEDIRDVLDYISDSLVESSLGSGEVNTSNDLIAAAPPVPQPRRTTPQRRYIEEDDCDSSPRTTQPTTRAERRARSYDDYDDVPREKRSDNRVADRNERQTGRMRRSTSRND